MASLPKSIIKKYGISKKAWSVFRSRGRSKSSAPKVKTMARRRKSTFRARARSSFRKRRSGGRSSAGLFAQVIGGAGYGFVRAPVSAQVQKLLPGVAGQYTDNIAMLGVSLMASQGKIPLVNKIPYSREIGKAGVYIESAMLGQELAGNILPSMSNGTSAGSATSGFGW